MIHTTLESKNKPFLFIEIDGCWVRAQTRMCTEVVQDADPRMDRKQYCRLVYPETASYVLKMSDTSSEFLLGLIGI